MRRSYPISLALTLILIVSSSIGEAKAPDPYKVLGVDKNATQREIQKAFHRLSLKYHPDKNGSKGAQEKFSEINNAYEILSDEEKRKNLDLNGDENSGPTFDTGGGGDEKGQTYFTGGQGNSRFTFKPGEWFHMGGSDGRSGSSYSFSSLFKPGDVLLNLLRSDFFGAPGNHGRRRRSARLPENMRELNARVFEKEVRDKGLTWLLMSHTGTHKGTEYYEAIGEVEGTLRGALKIGVIDCEKEKPFCDAMDVNPLAAPRLFVYSYGKNGVGGLVEYAGGSRDDLKAFCLDKLPRISKRVGSIPVGTGELPVLLLLSMKKDAPVIWRALSGLHRKRFHFYHATLEAAMRRLATRRLGVNEFPAIVGWLPNGEMHVLGSGVLVRNLVSGIHDVGLLIEKFGRRMGEDNIVKVQLLTKANIDTVCSASVPVCVIGVFRSSPSRSKLETILSRVSGRCMRRHRRSTGRVVSYGLLDGRKHSGFLRSFADAGYGLTSLDGFVLVYKPKRRKSALLIDDVTADGVGMFVSSVLDGDVRLTDVLSKPTIE